MLGDMIGSIAGMLIDSAPELLTAGLLLFTSLVTALADSAPALQEKLPELIGGLAAALALSAPILLEAGMQLFVALVEALGMLGPLLSDPLPEICLLYTSRCV